LTDILAAPAPECYHLGLPCSRRLDRPYPHAELRSELLWQLALVFGRHRATEWLTFNLREFLANIATFVPIALFPVLLLGRRLWWRAILIGVVLTVAIEYTQDVLPGRVSDWRDIVANSLGAITGTLLALLLTARKARAIAREDRAHVVTRPASGR